jgi:uncharacterized membrane protein YeaQ/YmgE (transglycosylase-associated protein family)
MPGASSIRGVSAFQDLGKATNRRPDRNKMAIGIGTLFGILAGAAARSIMPGPAAGGRIAGSAIGALGAICGGIGGAYWISSRQAFDVRELFLSIAGALLFLFLYRAWALGRES